MSRTLLNHLYEVAIQGAAPSSSTSSAVSSWIKETPSENGVHIISIGKAAHEMAESSFHTLQTSKTAVKGGIIISTHLKEYPSTYNISQIAGDHPVPDIGSLAAADALLKTIATIERGDDILVLISGGSSSLCAAPCSELTMLVGHPADAQKLIAETTDGLLGSGLPIQELNRIRRRLLRWGAGRLATAIHARGARQIRLMAVSDVIGDDLSIIGSGPCTADTSSSESIAVIVDAYGIRDRLNSSISIALGISGDGSRTIQTPPINHPAFQTVSGELVATNSDATKAVEKELQGTDIITIVFDAPIVGDAIECGEMLANRCLTHAARYSQQSVLIWGGEPVFTIPRNLEDEDGLLAVPFGGRMQALALSAALSFERSSWANDDVYRISLLAAGTDGRDGPTDAAGAIVNAETCSEIRRKGVDPLKDSEFAMSNRSLALADALIPRRDTGTNVADIVIVHIAAKDELING